jgi:PleD family two-component response regulator
MQEVSRRVEELPARYGGEGFVAILPGADPWTAQQAAEKLLQPVAARKIPHGASDAARLLLMLASSFVLVS